MGVVHLRNLGGVLIVQSKNSIEDCYKPKVSWYI